MNNYSFLQQKLHSFALSSKLLREVSFDIECSLFKEKYIIDNHVFVAGLARSGSTAILNAIHETKKFASLSYDDMPFVLSPNLWSLMSGHKKHSKKIERAHGDGILVSTESPEAFEEVFWKTFDEFDHESIIGFRKYVSLILKKYKKTRYLSKNNQNIGRLNLISSIFPKSKILVPFRDPLQHSFSLLTQHKKFIKLARKDKFISDYMRLIGHTEFGNNYKPLFASDMNFNDDLSINHWLEQWSISYRYLANIVDANKNINFVCYERLCNSEETWKNILKNINIKYRNKFDFKMSVKNIDLELDSKILEECKDIYKNIIQLSL
tara:strand:+ start:2771 stop:3739 length:969 start_codon:yes stop_codon:yes gene_type:complete